MQAHSRYEKSTIPPHWADDLAAEDILHIARQLSCSGEFAKLAFVEMNVAIVMDELQCERAHAMHLLCKHNGDPFVVRACETNFNAQLSGVDDHFELTHLRTSWGTTVPMNPESNMDFIITVDGKDIRVLDPDYLTFEWPDVVPPLQGDAGHIGKFCVGEDSSTVVSDGETSVASSNCSSRADFVAGDSVVAHGLTGAAELNCLCGQIVRHVPATGRFEVKFPGFSGTKGLKVANLRLS